MREVILWRVREPSRKPDEVYSRIERYCCAGPRLELFARESRANWTSWGDEAAKFDPSKAVAIPCFANPSGAGASLYRDAESAAMNDARVRIAGDSVPSAATAKVAEQLAFALAYEAACIAQDHADKLAHAAIRGDRAGARSCTPACYRVPPAAHF